MSARTRLYVLAGALGGDRKVTHTGRFPAISTDRMLPTADVLLIVADEDPGVMLFRYTAFGELSGDTWHPSVDDAQQQAAHEFGEALLLPWQQVDEDVEDAHQFVIRYAHDQLNRRSE